MPVWQRFEGRVVSGREVRVPRYFTDINESLIERLQAMVSQAKLLKAFSCV